MATISFSSLYAQDVIDSLSKITGMATVVGQAYSSNNPAAAAAALTYKNSINQNLSLGAVFGYLKNNSQYYSNPNSYSSRAADWSDIKFLNSSSQVLTQYEVNELTRTLNAEGYVIFTNFPPKTPVLAGTVATILIDTGDSKTIEFVVGGTGSGADIEFEDRDLVTTQPWRLDGSIKFRVPMSYEYST